MVPSYSSGIAGRVVDHRSEVPTWASCHKLRKITEEGLGWHICTLRKQKSHPNSCHLHLPPAGSRPSIAPPCGLPAEWKHLGDLLIMGFFPNPDSLPAGRTYYFCVCLQQHHLLAGESEQGWGGLTPSHMLQCPALVRSPSHLWFGAENRGRGLQKLNKSFRKLINT